MTTESSAPPAAPEPSIPPAPAGRRPLTREHALFGLAGLVFGGAAGFVIAWQMLGNARPGFTDRNGRPTSPLEARGGGEGATPAVPPAPFLNPDGSIDMEKVPTEIRARMEEAKKTAEEARAALDRNPADADALRRLSGVYLAIGKTDLIAEAFRRALEAAPADPSANVRLGDAAFDALACPEAVAFYDRALAKRPNDSNVLTDSAICLLRTERIADAEIRLRRAAAADPRHAPSRYYLALVEYFERKNRAASEALLAEAERLDPALDGIAEFRAQMAADAAAAAGGGPAAPPLPPGADREPLPPGHPPVTAPGGAAPGAP